MLGSFLGSCHTSPTSSLGCLGHEFMPMPPTMKPSAVSPWQLPLASSAGLGPARLYVHSPAASLSTPFPLPGTPPPRHGSLPPGP